MAGKKKPSIQNGLKTYKDVITRAGLNEFYNNENVLCSKNKNDNTIITIPDIGLWNLILEDPDYKDKIHPLNDDNIKEMQIENLSLYTCDLNGESWISLNTDDLYAGKVIKIYLDFFDYEIPITRDCLPLKLKKSEHNHIDYRIWRNPEVLGIKKYFPFEIEEYGFNIMRLFKII